MFTQRHSSSFIFTHVHSSSLNFIRHHASSLIFIHLHSPASIVIRVHSLCGMGRYGDHGRDGAETIYEIRASKQTTSKNQDMEMKVHCRYALVSGVVNGPKFGLGTPQWWAHRFNGLEAEIWPETLGNRKLVFVAPFNIIKAIATWFRLPTLLVEKNTVKRTIFTTRTVVVVILPFFRLEHHIC